MGICAVWVTFIIWQVISCILISGIFLLHLKEQYKLDPLHVIYKSVHVIYMVMGEFTLIPSDFCKILHAGSQHIWLSPA